MCCSAAALVFLQLKEVSFTFDRLLTEATRTRLSALGLNVLTWKRPNAQHSYLPVLSPAVSLIQSSSNISLNTSDEKHFEPAVNVLKMNKYELLFLDFSGFGF